LARKLKLTAKVKARQDSAKKKAMTREERDGFLAAAEWAEPWRAPLWTVQTLAGLRPGEVYALEERDLNLEGRTLRVERTLADDGQRTDTPKGGFGRDVDLSNEAVRVLRANLVRRREEKLRRGWSELPRPLFCSTATTYADPSGVRAAFRRVCKVAGLVDSAGHPRFNPHGLRHTYAALHLQAGTDVYYVSRMLGHADITLNRPHLRRLAPARPPGRSRRARPDASRRSGRGGARLTAPASKSPACSPHKFPESEVGRRRVELRTR
jgi:integrase